MDEVVSSPCACGSGLIGKKCCGQGPAPIKAVRICTPEAAASLKAAFEAFQAGRKDEATATCVALLTEEPALVPALHMLADIRQIEGGFDAEIALRRRIVAGVPDDVAHLVRFVTALIKNGDKHEAVAFARKAIWMMPSDPRANWIMALAFSQVYQMAEAEYHFDRAIEASKVLKPELLLEYAAHLRTQGKLDKARDVLGRLAPEDRDGLHASSVAASIEEAAGNLDRASEIAGQVMQAVPGDWLLCAVRARIAVQRRDFAGALAIVESGVSRFQRENSAVLLLLRGRILDELGRHDEAFADFAAGKALELETSRPVFQPDRFVKSVETAREMFNAAEMARLPRAPRREDVPQPLVVTGFPRSGTTMVEQTLSVHSNIAAGGELGAIGGVLNKASGLLGSRLAYPDALVELLVADRRHGLMMMRDDYLHTALATIQPKPGARWFTDKSLMNEGQIPTFALMFPHSPIINVVRHPLDSILSVFSHSLPDTSGYSMKLETAAQHFRASAEAAEQYRLTLPSIRYLRVRYEDILADQESEVRRMLDFIGEPYEPECLAFQNNERYAPTLSYAQVRRKLSQDRKYRYKPYLKHLEPVIPILQPVIDMLGYTIET